MAYLLSEVARVLPSARSQDVLFTYAGVRPLVRSGRKRKKESDVSRNYQIVDHASEGMDGLMISVLGVKLTSYRAASTEAVNLILRKLGLSRRFWTEKEPLPGAKGFTSFPAFVESQTEHLSKKYELEQTQSVHLLSLYGSRIGEICKIMDEDPSLARRICGRNPDILAEVVLAVREEFTVSLSDFMMRRVPLAFSECRGQDCGRTVAELMGRLQGWDTARIETEVATYEESVRSQFDLRPRISTA